MSGLSATEWRRVKTGNRSQWKSVKDLKSAEKFAVFSYLLMFTYRSSFDAIEKLRAITSGL